MQCGVGKRKVRGEFPGAAASLLAKAPGLPGVGAISIPALPRRPQLSGCATDLGARRFCLTTRLTI
jgi:hypothetical protein